MPPADSKMYKTIFDECDMYELIESGVEKYQSLGKVIVTGDLNGRTSKEIDYIIPDHYINPGLESVPNANQIIRKNMDQILDTQGKRIIQLCKSSNLLICNGRLHNDTDGLFTFTNINGNSTVDYLLMNINDFKHVTDFYVSLPTDLSDHNAINICLQTKRSTTDARDNVNSINENYMYLQYDETLSETYRNILLDNINTLEQLTDGISRGNIDATVGQFTTFIHDTAFNTFGKTRTRINRPENNPHSSTQKYKTSKPWFDKKCIDARKEFNSARNTYLRNKTHENKNSFLNKRRMYINIKRCSKRKYLRQEGNRLNNLAKNNPKSFWKSIKSQYKQRNTSPDVNINDLYEHFSNLYDNRQVNDNSSNEQHNEDINIYDEDLDTTITEIEVKHAILSQSNGKSPGTDQLIPELFKSSCDIITPFLTKLYNTIFTSGNYPNSWGEGIIVPIFKGGAHEAKNFRGITLNNILSKIYSKILVSRITRWSEKHKKVIDNQFGFQKNKSTIDCIFILHSMISKTISSKRKLYTAFLDWEKMFDRIDRLLLWRKLLDNGVSSKFTKALKSMYDNVRSFVKYNTEKSEFISSNIGVKQGDPSSSILCLFFLNDILNNINTNQEGILNVEDEKLCLLLFADDAVVFAHDPITLQSILNDIEHYCNTYGLKININKTKIMIFENGRTTNHDFYLYNTRLEIVSSFKYLGIYLFKNGNWSRTQKHISQQALFSLHNLFTVLNQTDLITSQKIELFNTLIEPILNYGSEIWGHHPAPEIESILNKFCRKILSVKRSTNIDALHGELGSFPMSLRRQLNMIKYWLKIIYSPENSLLYKTYKTLKIDLDANNTYNKNNWAYHIKTLLETCGLNYLWINQFNILINFQTIKTRLIDIYKQRWYASINNSSRLDTYSLIKHEFILENYLNDIRETNLRIGLTRLRLSSHDLNIEKGRHQNIDRRQRYCTNCNLHQIETEYHFILICPKYADLRTRYIKRYFYTWPTTNKFTQLFTTKSKITTQNLARFIFNANKIRN